jgi:GNAT superfamily N-acetyltransferase
LAGRTTTSVAVSSAVPIRIERLDATSDRDLNDVARLATSYWREVLGPGEPATTPAEMLYHLRLERADIDVTALLARDAGRAIGFATVDIRRGHGNEHMAWCEDLYVQDGDRRRGVGTALLHELIAACRSADRSLLLGAFAQGSVGGEAFAAHVGAAAGHRERQNRVRVRDLDRSLLERWVEEGESKATGYSLVQYDDRTPDDLVAHVVKAKDAMNDAPRTESLEDFISTEQHRRDAEADLARVGARSWYAGIRHDDTGDIAGYSVMEHWPWKPWLVEQGDTGVVAAHRGHGLGRWLKAVNALRVLDERADAEVIETWNDGSNRWMLAINDAMGFEPVATWVETELQLS